MPQDREPPASRTPQGVYLWEAEMWLPRTTGLAKITFLLTERAMSALGACEAEEWSEIVAVAEMALEESGSGVLQDHLGRSHDWMRRA